MLEVIQLYYTKVLIGRIRSIFTGPEFFVSLAVFLVVVSIMYTRSAEANSQVMVIDLPSIPVAEFARLLATYGALGMGSCVTTLALATRWSSADFNDFFRENAATGTNWASYSGFLFRLSWASLAHWSALMSGLLVALFAPPTWLMVPQKGDLAIGGFVSAALLSLFVYCVMCFLSAILGLSVLCIIRKNFSDNNFSDTPR